MLGNRHNKVKSYLDMFIFLTNCCENSLYYYLYYYVKDRLMNEI